MQKQKKKITGRKNIKGIKVDIWLSGTNCIFLKTKEKPS